MLKKMVSLSMMAVWGASGPAAMAQSAQVSKVQLWGIVDAAIRHTNNEGAGRDKKTQMIGGGMSQSRWGIKVEEALDGGTKALVELENRFTADDGNTTPGNGPFFQLAYVGLQGPFGRITMGRQWNVLFDVVTSTYASFPYSPYMDAYKPELGMAAGARSSNALKYMIANSDRSWVAGLQYAFDEGNTNVSGVQRTANGLALQAAQSGLFGGTPPIPLANAQAMLNSPLSSGAKVVVNQALEGMGNSTNSALVPPITAIATGAMENYGAYLRWSNKIFSVGLGALRTELPAGSKLDAWTLGGSYRSGALYVNAGYGENKVKYVSGPDQTAAQMVNSFAARAVDRAVVGGMWSGQTNGGFQPGDANKRKMYKLGFGYQLTPQLNLGAHYFHAKQSGSVGPSNGRADFMIVAGSYQLSKRTDTYAAVDHTKLSGGRAMFIDADSLARKRTGLTLGVRHRF